MMPSIWLEVLHGHDDWVATAHDRRVRDQVLDSIDDCLLSTRQVSVRRAWCAACRTVTEMQFHWHYGAIEPDGSVHPAWTETGGCSGCGLNSRMRATIALLDERTALHDGDCFLAEQVTPTYDLLRHRFRSLVGAEFLADDLASGSLVVRDGVELRHEDLTRLSFDDASFDLVVTQDVFEHIPVPTRAFSECWRVLRPGGRLIFTIPFFPDLTTTAVRATVAEDGSVTHLEPPEVHGNPLGGGSLCFQHFGWDLLDMLRSAGFDQAVAHTYWGPWQGHVGPPSFVFEATR